MAGKITNIFISYGRADSRELALRLRDDLQAVGYSVWLDLSEIPGGASWSEDIEHAIEHSHLVLALLSPASFKSQWCRAEQLRAVRKGKRLIPLMSIADSEIPLHLEHMNYLNFSVAANYDDMFRDLLSDITAGSAFARRSESDSKTTPSPYRRRRSRRLKDEKRGASNFRRYLRDLQQDEWLGARFWWPYFLFHFTDIYNVADILKHDELLSHFQQGGDLKSRFDKYVRLYFRPRTPDLFHAEGFRPSGSTAPLPVYLLFDLEAIVAQPGTRFTDGNPEKTKKSYEALKSFRDLPFEQIYHDSWFMPDEREEIMNCREAQVIVPERLGLEALQLIWLRSPAEYETLHQLLPRPLWHKWRDKITVRTDYHLFNNKRAYVQSAILEPETVQLRFNPCQQDCSPFLAQLIVEYADGEQFHWQDDSFSPVQDLQITLPHTGQYSVQFLLNGDLAYMGQLQAQNDIL